MVTPSTCNAKRKIYVNSQKQHENVDEIATIVLFSGLASLFSNMRAYPETLSTTYRAFSSLLDNYVATVRQAETSTMEQRLEVDTFLNAVVDTTVMKEAHSFLRYKGMTLLAEHCFTSQVAGHAASNRPTFF